MKNVIIGLIASMVMLTGSAFAGQYAGLDYQDKDKVGVNEHHDVLGAFVGTNFGKFGLEGRMENEVVHEPSKHEGLFQVRGAYNIINWEGLTPYVASAIGYKSKATINFTYYVVEGGLKYDVTKRLQVKAASRLRSPFGESQVGDSPNKFRSVENSVGVVFKLTPKVSLTGKAALEHGDSNYHTGGVGVIYNF